MITPSRASELLHRHGLAPSRALGQNFVIDPNTVRRIARLAELTAGDRVLEIGPGLGALTLALVECGVEITAIELDRGLMAVLGEVLAGTSVRLIEGDAMHVSWEQVLGVGPWALVANLPYNVATPLVADLLDGVPAITKMVVMVQREVAERLAARPGDTAYGAVSVKVAYWATAAIVAKVPATVFLPKPNVESAIVRIDRRGEPAVDPALQADLFALVRAGFAKRRKMLRGSLGAMVTAEQFAAAGVRPDQRAEELGVADWGRLAAAVQAVR